jgi:hypothetical protein
MMKGLLALIVGCFFVGNAVGASAGVASPVQATAEQSEMTGVLYTDEIDQSQTVFDGALQVGYSSSLGSLMNLSIAQSFVPQKEVLTRVQFLMGRNVTSTQPCVMAVRDNLSGDDLTTFALLPSAFPVVNGTPLEDDLAWVDFNLSDSWVTAGQTYYLVIYSTFQVGNFYWVCGNGSNNYVNGTVYLSPDNGTTWVEMANADGCFKTFGLEETFLSVTPSGGLGFSFVVKNIGNVTAWDVRVNLGFGGVVFPKQVTKLFPALQPGDELVVKAVVFGFGPTTISFSIGAANVREQVVEKSGMIILVFVLLR